MFCLLLAAGALPGQEAEDFFRQNCVSCHTIGGGRLTGPDLKGVSARKDPAWLTQFVQNPQAAIDGGDAYALKLQQESRGVVMPTVAGMSKARVESLLKLIDAESKLEKSQFAGLRLSDRPFTSADVEQGRNLFLGMRQAGNGAPSCISCHTVKGLGGLGGGRLGPDLTRVYERLEGRKNLAAWLYAPATPTMQPIFKRHALKPEEILPLVAFLERTTKSGGQADSVSLLNFVLIGLGGTAIALVLFDSTWKKRFRAVRRPLVNAGTKTGSMKGLA
ncbi:MAG: c-type cytochrome [Acidobacteriia bacterium]|nr:c-type cytochrome [Terriglobia bacterium]